MNDIFCNLRVFSPNYDAFGWGFDQSQIVDLDTALAQPIKIAVLPVYFEDPKMFSWKPEFKDLNISKFDLVLFTDIEFHSQLELLKWIESLGCTNWLLCVGGLYANETLGPRVVHRTPWSFNFLEWSPKKDDFPLARPFMFDCLCGARREHRDFVMLSLQKSGLLDKGIVTYRDIFFGNYSTAAPSWRLQNIFFPKLPLLWPYVSPNLDHAWEVKAELDNSISGLVPWEIYNRSYFTILMETLPIGDCFLMSEKVGKCFFARRLFVHFGVRHYLKNLHALGFETFHSVIDEKYDMERNDIVRWQAAFEQVKILSTENLPTILEKIRPILEHNHNRLFELKEEKRQQLMQMILTHLK